jgi:hypothetical protein
MDRSQGCTRLLIAASLLLLCGAAERQSLPIRESRWLASGNLQQQLLQQPVECLVAPDGQEERRSIAIGRAAFRSPLLLGGQAARAGLSCASCHRNGRGNPHFRFPGLSGEPGTADVTSSLMSKRRGDAAFNPKPIPDLAADASTFRISRDNGRDDLRRFIHGLIVEEFDGPEPPRRVLQGLTDYVRALSRSACTGSSEPVTLGSMLSDVDAAVQAARDAFAGGDAETKRAMLAAARAALGRIDERFQLPGLEKSRQLLREADAGLHGLQRGEAASPAAFDDWERAWLAGKLELRRSEDRSLFSASVLHRALTAPVR